jgi:pyruvate dehydrogenase E2 component (dihydrolipoamide acetyltransferase)
MATKVVMEALSPTMEEGRLVRWAKNEGDQIKSGDVLAEVETDKAVMELVARGDGVLRKRLANEGDASPVGTLLAVIAAPDENIDSIIAAAATAPKPAEPAAAAPPSSVPATQGQSQGEASMPPQEKPQPAAARVAAPPPPPPPRRAAVGAGTRAPSQRDGGHVPAPSAAPNGTGGRVRSSPLARRLASEGGIELGAVQGSGPGGRVVKRDIEAAMASGGGAGPRRRATVPRPEGDYYDVPLTQIRKTIARRLAESLGPIPTFYLTAEFDMGRAADMRAALAEMGDEYKVSFNDIVLKATALALAEHPEVNALWLGDGIRHFNRVHLALAVAVEDGLITPVIFDADQKHLADISQEAKQLAGLARDRRLTPEQYTGGTFSVSNLGMFGIDHFTAIINPPEAGIIAVGGVEDKAVVVDGEIAARKRMRVTMSCDHRVIDGATGAKFLQTLRRYLENPLLLVY